MPEGILKENNMIKFFMNYKKMQGKVFDNLFPFKHYLKILPKKKKYKKLNVKDFGNALFDAYEDQCYDSSRPLLVSRTTHVRSKFFSFHVREFTYVNKARNVNSPTSRNVQKILKHF